MHVLGVRVQGGSTGVEVGGQRFQPPRDGLGVLSCDYSTLPQHSHMRDAALNIVGPQPLVEAKGGVELMHERVGFLGEAPGPEFGC